MKKASEAQLADMLFMTATRVRSGRGRIFRNGEITPDADGDALVKCTTADLDILLGEC